MIKRFLLVKFAQWGGLCYNTANFYLSNLEKYHANPPKPTPQR